MTVIDHFGLGILLPPLNRSSLVLLNDAFLTDDAAPIASPRTAEPGPGTLTIGDTANSLAISGGEIVPSAGTAANGNPSVYQAGGYSRVAGRAFKVDVKRVSAYGANANKLYSPGVGWNSVTGNIGNLGLVSGIGFAAGAFMFLPGTGGVTSPFVLDACASDTYYEFGLVLMSAGMILMIDRKVAFVLRRNTTATLYPHVAGISGDRHPPGVDNFVVADLGGAWASPTSIATSWLSGARSAGETFTHQADCLIEFTATLPSAGNVQIAFRKQDANNYWQLSLNSAGTLALNEVVAGTPTARATIVGTQTGDRLGVMAFGSNMKLFVDRATAEATGNTYASATNFQTQTSGEIQSLGTGGGASDVISWPRDPDADAMARYDSV